MLDLIIPALLPIVITLLLGFIAGWHHDFDASQGAVLNRMVMLYALPLTLFAGMMGLSRSVLLSQGIIAVILLAGMVGGYLIVYLLVRYLCHQPAGMAALLALAISGPAVPFVGVPVLGHLYGTVSTLPIALCSIIMNLFQVPLTILILSAGNRDKANTSFSQNILHTLKEPVVWAPLLALLLLLLNLHIPAALRSALQLLGGTTGGVALFASGVILFSYHVVFDRTVILSVLAKNIILPLLILILARALHTDGQTLSLSVISMAIPSASVCVILAVQYKTAGQEMASILFFSTLFSILTMGGMLYYLAGH
ncbi:AEC family transporter [Tatumella saanichensis]|uniref:AEC family transporter n=1 Tax=Tatumella saanichensis TaxID=480813 RepID=UPI0004A49C56|nr:AEC family transporter [Tatumella saanichensis]